MTAAWLDGMVSGFSREEFSSAASIAWKQQPSKIVLHSTEGGSFPSAATYKNGRSAPHFTIDLRARQVRQHYPLTEAAWALVAATTSTNSMGAIQIEIIGTADDRSAIMPKMSALTDGELEYLAELLSAISRATGIPLTSSVDWRPYPSSYGVSASQRLSVAAWVAYRGVLGHQHAPGNSHGDPGALDAVRLLQLATNTPTAGAAPSSASTPDEESDMRIISAPLPWDPTTRLQVAITATGGADTLDAAVAGVLRKNWPSHDYEQWFELETEIREAWKRAERAGNATAAAASKAVLDGLSARLEG